MSIEDAEPGAADAASGGTAVHAAQVTAILGISLRQVARLYRTYKVVGAAGWSPRSAGGR